MAATTAFSEEKRKESLTYFQNVSTTRASQFDYMPIIAAYLVLKLSKTPEGLKVLKALGTEFIKGIFKTLNSLGKASAANKVAAWANPVLISGVLDRFGFLKPGFNNGYHLGVTVISGASIAEGFLDTLQGFFPFSSPEPSDFPSHISFGDEGVDRQDIDFEAFGLLNGDKKK